MPGDQIGRTSVIVVADADGFEDGLQEALRRAGRSAGRALDRAIRGELTETGRRAARRIVRDVQRQMRELQLRVRVVPDMRGFQREARRAAREMSVRVRVEPDMRGFQRAAQQAARRITVRVRVEPDGRGLRGGQRGLRSAMGGAAGLGGMAGQAGQLTGRLGAAGSAAASIVGSILAAVGALAVFIGSVAVAGGALAALPAAFAGLGVYVLKDTKKIKKAFEGLKDTAKETFRDAAKPLVPAFTAAIKQVRGIIKGLGPQLKQGFKATAPLIKPLVSGGGALAENAMPGIVAGLKAAKPVIDVVRDALGKLGTAVSSVFKSFAANSGGIAGNFDQVLSGVIGLIAPLGRLIATIASTKGTGLGDLFSGIGKAISEAAPGLGLFFEGFNSFLSAMSPLIPILGQFVGLIGAQLGTALRVNAAFLRPFAALLAKILGPVLRKATAAFIWFGEQMTKFGPQVKAAFAQIKPAFGEVKAALAPMVAQMRQAAPVIKQVAAALFKWGLLKVVIPGIKLFVFTLASVVRWTLRVITVSTKVVAVLYAGWIKAAGFVTTSINRIVLAIASLPGRASAYVNQLSGRLTAWFLGMWARASGIVNGGVNRVVGWFSSLPERAMAQLQSLPGRLYNLFAGLWGQVQGAVNGLISSVVAAFGGLPGKILSSLGDIGGRIRNKIAGSVGALGGFIPGFADGGIHTREQIVRVGEGGRPEVTIPLTKPARAAELARRSGLLDILAKQDAGGRNTTIHNTFHVQSRASNPQVLAHIFAGRIAQAAGV